MYNRTPKSVFQCNVSGLLTEIKQERVHDTIDTHQDELLFGPITSLLMFPDSPRQDMVQCSVEKSEPTPSNDLL